MAVNADDAFKWTPRWKIYLRISNETISVIFLAKALPFIAEAILFHFSVQC